MRQGGIGVVKTAWLIDWWLFLAQFFRYNLEVKSLGSSWTSIVRLSNRRGFVNGLKTACFCRNLLSKVEVHLRSRGSFVSSICNIHSLPEGKAAVLFGCFIGHLLEETSKCVLCWAEQGWTCLGTPVSLGSGPHIADFCSLQDVMWNSSCMGAESEV